MEKAIPTVVVLIKILVVIGASLTMVVVPDSYREEGIGMDTGAGGSEQSWPLGPLATPR